ncbi:MAG: hypothetical protein LBS02_19085, partial [Hungatella sp.]|nr:hypothetical protein [Hungatella sp.]
MLWSRHWDIIHKKPGAAEAAPGFLHYRKLRKQSKIVYNGFEIKNSIAKERSIDFAMTLYMR